MVTLYTQCGEVEDGLDQESSGLSRPSTSELGLCAGDHRPWLSLRVTLLSLVLGLLLATIAALATVNYR